MKIYSETHEDLGYPHELLFISSEKAKEVLRGRYRTRTKLFAAFFLSVLGQKVELNVDTQDPYSSMILQLTKGSKIKARKIAKQVAKKLKEYVDQFEQLQTKAAFYDFRDYLENCIYLHVVSKAISRIQILPPRIIEQCIDNIKPESDLKYFLVAIQLLENKEIARSVEINKIINTFLSTDKSPLLEAALFLSFLLAVNYPDFKSSLLITHYTILKNVTRKFEKLIERDGSPDDPVLQNLFMTSIVLFLCGYLRSLRLSHEEKINYMEQVMEHPFIEWEIRVNFDKVSRIKMIPIWGLLISSIALILLHVFVEVYLPGSISMGPLSLTLPNVPVFLTITLIVLSFTTYKIIRLKDELLDCIRKGRER